MFKKLATLLRHVLTMETNSILKPTQLCIAWNYICLSQPQVVIGQFGCNSLPPSDTQGKPATENIFNSLQLFEFWVKSHKTFKIVMIRLSCFE